MAGIVLLTMLLTQPIHNAALALIGPVGEFGLAYQRERVGSPGPKKVKK